MERVRERKRERSEEPATPPAEILGLGPVAILPLSNQFEFESIEGPVTAPEEKK